ncbi:hypothetical protein F5Y01DRAFT_299660 [Xylaria sp. FL0043]|nr:hypothetical protein F5Y01DRAFT_299660 [Xylaria sp. FL0043]
MPKSLGGPAHRLNRDASLHDVTHTASHSDPTIPLVSVFWPAFWHPEQFYIDNPQPRSQDQPPRPRISIQVYYTAPDAADPSCLESAARALEKEMFWERHQGTEPNECDRLDVYGMPSQQLGGRDVVTACIEHQKREIGARLENKDWYIQRYDLGGHGWRRALVIVRKGVKEWIGEDGTKRPIGLSRVYFDRIAGRHAEGDDGREFLETVGDSASGERCLMSDLKHDINWQHTAWQFEDWAFSCVSQLF